MLVFEEEPGTTTMDESDEAGDSDCDSTDSDRLHSEHPNLPEPRASLLFCRSFQTLQAADSSVQPRLVPTQSVSTRILVSETILDTERSLSRL